MTELVLYEQARSALAAARSVDEVLQIHDWGKFSSAAVSPPPSASNSDRLAAGSSIGEALSLLAE